MNASIPHAALAAAGGAGGSGIVVIRYQKPTPVPTIGVVSCAANTLAPVELNEQFQMSSPITRTGFPASWLSGTEVILLAITAVN